MKLKNTAYRGSILLLNKWKDIQIVVKASSFYGNLVVCFMLRYVYRNFWLGHQDTGSVQNLDGTRCHQEDKIQS